MRTTKKPLLGIGLVGFMALSLSSLFGQGLKMESAWSLYPGDRYYLGTGSNQRGMGYNPLTGHLILVNRQTGYVTVNLVDSATGDDAGTMDTTSLTNGGTFPLNQIRVADDGVVYGANFGTIDPAGATPYFTLYRWSDEGSPSTIAYSGDPGAGNLQQWGYTLAVRGAGTNTEILITSSGTLGNIAALFTTPDGTNFVSQVLATDVIGGQMASAVAFGETNTFWTKSFGTALYQLRFDTNNGTATTINKYSITNFPASIGPFNVNLTNGLLAGIDVRTPDLVDLYSISNLTAGPVLLDDEAIPFGAANGGAYGSVAFAGGMVFTLDCNNGLQGWNIVPSSAPLAPLIILQPAPATVFAGLTASMAASAAGSSPLSYQWLTNGVPALGATNAVFTITNVTTAYDADYFVIVTNSGGAATSSVAHMTVLPPGVMTPLWSLQPGSRTYLKTSGSWQRSIAYNPVTKHVLVATRGANGPFVAPSVNAVKALDGADVGPLSVAGINNASTFPLMMIGVADDGVIYGANYGAVSTNTPAIIYRWATEASTPTIAFQGDPANWVSTNFLSYGAALSVRGAGRNTQILLPSNIPGPGSAYASILTTADGTNFTSTLISGLVTNTVYEGAAFGVGNTFWGKADAGYASTNLYGATAGKLVYYSFDLSSATATLIGVYDSTSQFDQNISPIGVDANRRLLGGIFNLSSGHHNFQLYDISQISPTSGPVFLQKVNTPLATSSNPGSGLYRGGIAIGDGMFFGMDLNNGMAGYVLPYLAVTNFDRSVAVSWASTLAGFNLQSATNLTGSSWKPVPGAVTSNGTTSVTFPQVTNAQYFRLVK